MRRLPIHGEGYGACIAQLRCNTVHEKIRGKVVIRVRRLGWGTVSATVRVPVKRHGEGLHQGEG